MTYPESGLKRGKDVPSGHTYFLEWEPTSLIWCKIPAEQNGA